MQDKTTRRDFLKTVTIAAGALSMFPGCVTTAPRKISANSKLNHACIGVGGMMGGNDLGNFKSHSKAQIVAICDVDSKHLEKAAVTLPDARRYTDWREMLAKEGDRMSGVMAGIVTSTLLRFIMPGLKRLA